MKINIIITLQIEGRHRWAECPIPEMSFLRDYHRHQFHVKCEKAVSHSNRDVEIIKFQREVRDYFQRNYFKESLQMCDFENKSCEDLCIDLIEAYDLESCEILEDGENGSKVYKS